MMLNEKTPFINTIMCEIEYRKKINLPHPKCLIISDIGLQEKFFTEVYHYILSTDGAKFENPINGFRQFMGMNVITINICYGGTFKWAFGE